MANNVKRRKLQGEAKKLDMAVHVNKIFNNFESTTSSTSTITSQDTFDSVEDLDNFDRLKNNNQMSVQQLNIPVIDVSNIVSFKEFQEVIFNNFNKLFEEIGQLKKELKEVKSILTDKNVVHENKYINFSLKYNFQLPLKTVDQFFQFDELLKTNNLFKIDVCGELKNCFDRDDVLTRTIVCMLKKFISKSVAINFTAARKRTSTTNQQEQRHKYIFKTTEFCKCMDATIISYRNLKNRTTSDKDLMKALSDVLCNAKNWHE